METRNTRITECEDVDVDNTEEEIRTRDDQERHLTDERSTPMRLA
jgi:cytidylate kinase